MDLAGNYTLATGAAFGPASPVWTYTATPPTNFYSSEISGAQRLPNGNTLICEGIKGNLFEVTSAGQTVWSYMCPVTTTILTQGDAILVDAARPDQLMNAVFRVTRYPTNYAGLLGRDLTSQGTIEIPQNQTLKLLVEPAIAELCRALQGHARCADLDQYCYQPQHRHGHKLHGHERRPPHATAGLLQSSTSSLSIASACIKTL